MPKIKGTSLLGVKEFNRIQIRRMIYRHAPVTRQAISAELSLTLPTITTNIANMLSDGILTEYEDPNYAASPQGGRKAQVLNFRADSYYSIGVELGPYRTCICLTDLRGNPVCRRELPVVSFEYDKMIDFIVENIIAVREESTIKIERLLGVGLGLPGFIEEETGIIRTGSYISWSGMPLKSDLSNRINLPVWIENNVRMRAVGFEMFSNQNVPDTFAYLYVSKGIACPLMIKNDVLEGYKASAGVIGHTTILPGGPVCPLCGKQGCLESVSGENAILALAQAAVNNGQAPMLAGLISPGGALTMKNILEAQRMNDPQICSIMDTAVDYLGYEAANIFMFISPSLFVVDGYIFENEVNRKRLQETAHKNLYGLSAKEAYIKFVPFDSYTGAYGAAAYTIRRQFLE
ncbi:MAG: ROK family protein [Anaerocolumna sp.]